MAKRKSIIGKRKKRVASPLNQSPPVARAREQVTTPTRSSEELEASTTQYRVSKGYRNLEPRIKHISQDIILSKWTILDEDAQVKVRSMLRSVDRPVSAQHVSEQGKVEAQGTIGSLSRTLSNRLPKMVFPPKTKEQHFDYEALIKSNRSLQQRLDASQDSIATLREAVERHKGALARDQEELEILETSP